jgi:predicted transcriptional regulator of viral defense system
MRDAGLLKRLSRGLYRLTEAPPLGDPDLVTVALRAPDAVICLISALAHHDLTTQVPHAVYVALPTGARKPRLRQPPLEVFEFGGEAWREGIETHELDGVPVRIYSPEKTLADCFKYRNKLGLDTAIEALKLYVERGEVDVDAIMRYARICRVARVMRPYLEAVL